MQFLDIGLVNHSLGIQAQLMALDDLNKAYKGALIPQLINQELIARNTRTYHKPHFWVREKSQSSAEIDLVIPYKDLLIPVEIKSGPKGSLRSLHQFVDRASHPFAVRLFAGKFDLVKTQTPEGKPYVLMNLPYYLGGLLPEYIQFLVESEGREY